MNHPSEVLGSDEIASKPEMDAIDYRLGAEGRWRNIDSSRKTGREWIGIKTIKSEDEIEPELSKFAWFVRARDEQGFIDEVYSEKDKTRDHRRL